MQIERQFVSGPLCGGGLGADQVPTGRQRCGVQQCPNLASQSIANDRGSDGATECIGHPRWRCNGIEEIRAPQDSGPGSPALAGQARERAAFPDTPDQADRLCRPLARRAFNTARPARVLIR